MTEEDILAFVRASLSSVWTLEVLLLLKSRRERAWRAEDLVLELRSSSLAVEAALAVLHGAGLAARGPDGLYEFRPASPDLESKAEGVAQLYAAKPITVIRAIAEAPEEKLRIFARAFRLKE